MCTIAGGVTAIPITKELLCYASNARKKYEQYLDDMKKEQKLQRTALKRKAIDEEIENLKKKFKYLQQDCASLQQSADSKAEKAEKLNRLDLIAQSNALRKKSREKAEEIKNVEKLIQEKSAV